MAICWNLKWSVFFCAGYVEDNEVTDEEYWNRILKPKNETKKRRKLKRCLEIFKRIKRKKIFFLNIKRKKEGWKRIRRCGIYQGPNGWPEPNGGRSNRHRQSGISEPDGFQDGERFPNRHRRSITDDGFLAGLEKSRGRGEGKRKGSLLPSLLSWRLESLETLKRRVRILNLEKKDEFETIEGGFNRYGF